MKSDQNKQLVAITHGDINGIGYEVIIKTLMDNRIIELCTPVIYGSPKIAAYHRKALNITNFSLNNIRNPQDAHTKRSNIINCIDDNIRVELGKLTDQAGQASLQSLERVVKDIHDGKIEILVTAPINKQNIPVNDEPFTGHTEYLAQSFGCSGQTIMIMLSGQLRVAIATGHMALSKVPSMITKEYILNKLRILNKSMIEDFGIRKPKIAVLGLNPHAGDNGLMGEEEIEHITPAINELKNEGILALGPYSADGIFGSNSYTKFDVILAMYHDQGLTPFKSLAFEDGVNFTAGLPFVRTSPAHGTAFEISGQNNASETSFRQALYTALEIHKKRTQYTELKENSIREEKNQNNV